ncbi:MAG: hypothetical protein SGBAC_008872 [Bacillariaceae sp.]
MTCNSAITKGSIGEEDEPLGNASEAVGEKEELVEEEAWMTADGSNVFDLTFENKMVRSTMKNLFPNSERALIFDSYSTQEMTPLDMLYDMNPTTSGDATDENNNGDNYKFDEFYDGTGSLVWLACIAFCHMVAQDLISPLATESNAKKEGPHGKNDAKILQICELGCGAGLASIATLLSSAVSREIDGKPIDRKVILTDNDPEALELAKLNCELNQLDPASYDFRPLSWGSFPQKDDPKSDAENTANIGCTTTVATTDQTALQESTMDIVLAADVIYDISMIPPLLQTAAWLLKPSGSLVISHVPRFCLPKDETEQEEESQTQTSSPQKQLEAHIIEQASLVGLQLAETIRPHEALASVVDKDIDWRSNGSGMAGTSGMMGESQISCARLEQSHAVLFLFNEKIANRS